MALAPLADWANFYVILGSCAGGLTGLTFVVIALAGESRRVNPMGVHSFVTSIIVHFGAVLTLAAFLCVPHQTLRSLAIGVGALGAAGLIYIGWINKRIRRSLGTYEPVWEDWLCHVILPGLSYAALAAMGYLARTRPDAALDGVAAASLVLLFTGIHNAWDSAVWMTLRNQDGSNKQGGSKESTPGSTGGESGE
jgi:hypothetical protein